MKNQFYNKLTFKELSQDLEMLLIDFDYLQIFKQYGTCCLFMSSLLQAILYEQGYDAHIVSCNALLEKSVYKFYLGHPGYGKPGQFEGHFVCVVHLPYQTEGKSASALIDFSTGNIQRYFDENFYRALALPISYPENLEDALIASIQFDEETQMQWLKQKNPENLKSLLQEQEKYLHLALTKFHQYQANRIGFSLHSLFDSSKTKQAFNLNLS